MPKIQYENYTWNVQDEDFRQEDFKPLKWYKLVGPYPNIYYAKSNFDNTYYLRDNSGRGQSVQMVNLWLFDEKPNMGNIKKIFDGTLPDDDFSRVIEAKFWASYWDSKKGKELSTKAITKILRGLSELT